MTVPLKTESDLLMQDPPTMTDDNLDVYIGVGKAILTVLSDSSQLEEFQTRRDARLLLVSDKVDELLTEANDRGLRGTIVTAVDDAFAVPKNSNNNVLDVLANDSTNGPGALSINLVGILSGPGICSLEGLVILYSPQNGFSGVETFSYSVTDGIASAVAEVMVTVT